MKTCLTPLLAAGMRFVAGRRRGAGPGLGIGNGLGIGLGIRLGLGLGLAAGLGACGPQSAVERGEAVFASPALSASPSNPFSCATCHATGRDAPAAADLSARRHPGFPLGDTTLRSKYWCGDQTSLLDAVNLCLVEFMRGEPLPPENEDGRALFAYLQSLAGADAGTGAGTGPLPPRSCTIVRSIDDTYLGSLPKGDPARGAPLYQAACGFCHGDKDTGQGRLSDRIVAIPQETITLHGAEAPAVLIEKVRHGKFFGIAGNMPPYPLESLSDAELADITAYLIPR